MAADDDRKNPKGGAPVKGRDPAAVAADKARTASGKRGPGRPRNDGAAPGAADDPSARAAADYLSGEMERLFSPDAWKGLVRAPADIKLAITGRKHWELSERETETLAQTGSAAARYFANFDPKWLALTLFITNAALIYGSRFMADAAMNRAEAKAAQDKIQKAREEAAKPVQPV